MTPQEEYIEYIAHLKRYSSKTVETYKAVLDSFSEFCSGQDLICSLNPQIIRAYEASLVDGKGLSSASVNLQMSVLSGFCRWAAAKGLLSGNPMRTVSRPKKDKTLPLFYREESMREYFSKTAFYSSADLPGILKGDLRDKEDRNLYKGVLERLIVNILYSTGIRRGELIALQGNDADLSRRTLSVHGKGNKMRLVPLTSELCEEISLYLQVREKLGLKGEVLLLTPSGRPLYPVFVDRAVKEQLSMVEGISIRRSPHVLRHTLATELLDKGAPIESIRELLGHSSLAATQVYTHNSVEKLRKAYMSAHPRAKEDKDAENR